MNRNKVSLKYVVWTCLSLCLGLLVSCRSLSSSIEVAAEITPEPIVGQIATLHIEAVSRKYSGDGVISIIPGNNINIVDGDLEWRGPVTADEPFVYELSFCITQPGQTGFYMAVVVDTEVKEDQLYITSTAHSAEVVPSSEHEVHQAPLWSTPTPTPEPVIVSPECAGEEQ